MVIVDTTIWVDYLNGVANPKTTWLDTNLGRQRLGLTDLILCEVLQGLRNEREVEQVTSELTRFAIFPTGGVNLAISAARNYRVLRRRGITVRRTIDVLIATFCIENEHTLLHNDHDFDGFELHLGLQVVHPEP